MKEKPGISRFAVLLLVLLLTAAAAKAQSDWPRFEWLDATISFSLPPSYLVHRAPDRMTIFATSPEGEFTFSIEARQSARRYVKDIGKWTAKGSRSDSEEGKEFYIRKFEYDRPTGHVGSIYYGTGDLFVTFSFSTDAVANPGVQQFLSSIDLSRSAKFRTGATAASPSRIKMTSLVSSPEVLEALRMPDAPANSVTFGPVPYTPRPFDKQYSRRLFVVEKPQALYTERARQSGRQGSVWTRVEFLANGQLGAIVVDPKLDRGLAENAAQAARQIKSVPAQVNGRPVDMVKYVEYAFSLY